jgi:hypothetical protein
MFAVDNASSTFSLEPVRPLIGYHYESGATAVILESNMTA